MNCTNSETELIAFLSGDLDKNQSDEMTYHVESCPECRVKLDSLSGLMCDIRNLKTNDMPLETENRVLNSVKPFRKKKQIPLLKMRWKPALALMAILVIMTSWIYNASCQNRPAMMLEIGSLQPASTDSQQQSQSLDMLITARRELESRQSQGDAMISVTQTRSDEMYNLAQAQVKENKAIGLIIRAINRQQILGPTRSKYRWVYSGDKLRYETSVEGKPESLEVQAATDGVTSYIYSVLEKKGRIVPGLAVPLSSEVLPAWLTLTTVGQKQISELLESEGVTYDGKQTVGSVECLKVSIPYDDGILQIWFSPDAGYRAKRTAFSQEPKDGKPNVCSVAEVDSYRYYNGYWFPVKGTYSRFRVTDNTVKKWIESIEWETLSYTPEVDDGLFKIQFPEGTSVMDLVEMKK